MQYTDDKYYFKNVAMSTTFKRRFRNSQTGMTRIADHCLEIEILKILNHRNCVRVVDFISRDGAEFAVFPLMQVFMLPAGRLLYHCDLEIDMYSPLSLANDISSALEYLHSKCIAHRDVKPDNVLFNRAENIFVLSDFGSAIILPVSSSGILAESPATVAFYPPEVCIVNAAPTYNAFSADLWALGMTVYCSILNKLPYSIQSDSYVELVDEIAKFVDPYPIINQVAESSVRDVLITLLADRRYLETN